MSVLVTGANGFIGHALSENLLRTGHIAVCAVRSVGKYANQVAVGNIDGHTNWRFVLSRCGVVVHLAACAQVVRDSAVHPIVELYTVNVDGTLNLARQAAEVGVRRFVFLSSVKVHGEGACVSPSSPAISGEMATVCGEEVRYSEVDTPAPVDAYAISKWKAEQGLMAIARETGMEVVIIRPPLVYGPGVKGNFASLVKWARKGVPLPFGAVQNKRSLIALDNLVSFIALCADPAKSPKAANQVFLISDGEDVSTAELIHRVAQAYGTKAHLIPVPPAWMRFGARLLGKTAVADRLLGSLVIDSSKARELLGWQPVVTMDEQLRKMASDAAPV